MIGYEVTVNGVHLYTAGMEAADQFEARLDKVPGTTAIVLSVSAFAPTLKSSANHVEWKTVELDVGDAVTLRVVETETVDPPLSTEEREAAAEPVTGEDAGGGRLVCSFCGKGQHDVGRMVAGANATICDECVEMCAEIVAEGKGSRVKPG